MIAAIARKELVGLARDRRVLILGLGLLAMLIAVHLVVLGQQQRLQAERLEIGETARAQWDKQGIKHPHRGAHFGMYAFRSATPLAAFDPGIEPYVGQAIWLEPHRRNMARFNPAADAGPGVRFGSIVPAFLLTTLFPLLIMALTFNQVTQEREQGTLRMLQSMGVSNLAILGGKLIAIVACLAVVFLLAFTLVAASAYWRPGAAASPLPHIVLLGAAYFVYAIVMATLGLALGALCRGSRGALFVLVIVWAVFVLAAPRFGAAIAQTVVPLPSASQFWGDIARDYTHGLPGDPDLATQVREFEAGLLRKYDAAALEQVPIGVYAARRLMRDAYADKVHAHHFAGLWGRYARQRNILRGMAILSPAIPLREISMSLSGTSLAHQRHFEEAAEQYRRDFNTAIDEWDMTHSRGVVSYETQYAADSVWQSVPVFGYEPPSLGFSVSVAALDAMLLAAWVMAAMGLLCFAARRLQP